MGRTGRPGRVLGLDLGDARIGVAISDDERRMAVAFGTIPAGAPADVAAVVRLVDEQGISAVVVGLPLSLSGERGPRAAQAEAFVGVLRTALRVPVELQDERLSTVQAERSLREAGTTGVDRRRVIDQAAAAVILQAWIDAHG
jgi:putative Holliday junction resolvase